MNSRIRLWLRRLAISLCLIVAYFLSLGPLAWFIGPNEKELSLFAKAYIFPLYLLATIWPDFGKLILWYIAHFVSIG
ncbi:hypothetical protein SAMN05421753_111141 [Planctomicrobium piriforme]|uniref:Uncharacterized protein n=1 Tax=Planctomicrobium piriforme TaxID=1576369 RepID=A0A1I3K7Z0_9PLAN|nr:hypothetical protein SAMN05421753_111141 [Planctomicrobium piriforme]